jgi:hypothetical protein
MTTAEINAYLDWRAQREGRQVDVSPEAYRRDCIIKDLMLSVTDVAKYNPSVATADVYAEVITVLQNLVREYELTEKEN